MSEIRSVSTETRVFNPPASARWALCAEAKDHPDRFWSTRANEELHWQTPFHTVSTWHGQHAEWFVGGKLNISYDALDAQLPTRGEKIALRG